MTQTMIESLQSAWSSALEEFLTITPVGERAQLAPLQSVIQKIRFHQLLREGKNETFTKQIYDDIRNIEPFYLAVMAASTAFQLEISDLEEAVKFFARRCEVYTAKSNVVSNADIGRKAPVEALETILKENPWLFMLCFASTQERLTLRKLVEAGYSKVPHK